MYFNKILFKVFIQVITITLWMEVNAQSIPEAPSELDFAGISIQLTPPARQRLQQSLQTLYVDRALLLNQIETLDQLWPLIDPRLTEKAIPLDFRYVCPPLADSSYDQNAYWGLKIQQAPQLRLRVDQLIDSRRHVILSTEAVLPYLKQLQQQHRSWIKVLYRYFDPAVKLPTEVDLTHSLIDLQAPPAVWSILARKIAFEHEQALLKWRPSFLLLEYPESNGKTLADIAEQLRLVPDRLTPYNKWLITDRVPANGTYPVILRLTADEYLTVKPRLAPKPVRLLTSSPLSGNDLGFPILRRLSSSSNRATAIFYDINGRRGIQAQLCDNPITLAYYGQIPIPTFLKINDLAVQDILRPGEVYYLESKARRAKIPFHVVQQNQTLRDLSEIYGVRLKQLLRYNRIKPNQRVQTGRIIWMQRRRPADYPVEFQSVPPPEKKPLEEPPVLVSAPSLPVDSATLAVNPPAPVTAPVPVAKPAPSTKPDSTAPVSASLAPKISPVAPVAAAPAAVKPAETPVPAPSVVTSVHIVKLGQTYFSIARLYGTTVDKLYAWNNLSAQEPLLVGQELIIHLPPANTQVSGSKPPVDRKPPVQKPAVVPLPALTQAIQYHTVKPGETVYRIALNAGVSVPDLMRWNGLTNFTIEVGQRLITRPKRN